MPPSLNVTTEYWSNLPKIFWVSLYEDDISSFFLGPFNILLGHRAGLKKVLIFWNSLFFLAAASADRIGSNIVRCVGKLVDCRHLAARAVPVPPPLIHLLPVCTTAHTHPFPPPSPAFPNVRLTQSDTAWGGGFGEEKTSQKLGSNNVEENVYLK
jgi:hypothetical protein